MIILIISLILTLVGIYLCFSDYTFGTVFNLIGAILVLIFGITFLTYSIGIPMSYYNYQELNVKRQSIQHSIDLARQNPNSLELASVTRDVIDFNKELALQQYQNTLFICNPLIDDRVMQLPTIK